MRWRGDDIELLAELELYQGLLEIMCPYGSEITEVIGVVRVWYICTVYFDVGSLLIGRYGTCNDRRGGGVWFCLWRIGLDWLQRQGPRWPLWAK